MSTINLKDQIVFITGASAGIGEACAQQFAAAGARLVLAARRLDRLQSLSDNLDVPCHIGALDVRDRSAVQEFVRCIPPEFCAIDILLNNAGLAAGLAPIPEGDYSHWDRMIDTNVKGLLNLTREVVPGMIKRGRGHVINIGSIAGRQVYPKGGVYCATKFAVHALTHGLMMDLISTPVRVSTVDPGMVETEFSLVRFDGDSDKAKVIYQGLQPLKAEDVAEAVLWVASRPAHVNVAEVLILPTDQASANLVNRRV